MLLEVLQVVVNVLAPFFALMWAVEVRRRRTWQAAYRDALRAFALVGKVGT